MVGQYIQMPRIAKDFANYLEMFYKYQKTYHVEGILSGTWENITVLELREAPFDEKLSVMGWCCPGSARKPGTPAARTP